MSSPVTSPMAETTLVVQNAEMKRVYERARRVASARLPVLITGETGSGKELVAQHLHDQGCRARGPFVPLNCGALPANLVESVLFGHVRGAFTGADRSVQGAFQQADGGTLFLDEIGELSPAAQAALLRVIETGCVRPLGATHEVRADVRIVAATHRDLEQMVEEGRFRRDLLHRIDALQLRLPPLRERVDEIEPLARMFLERATARAAAPMPRGFDATALDALRAYAWPGNVRELRNAVEGAAALCERESISAEDLPARIVGATPCAAGCTSLLPPSGAALHEQPAPMAGASSAYGRGAEPLAGLSAPPPSLGLQLGDYRSRLRAYETALLLEGLRRAGGNQCRAAQLLDIPRRTLCRRIKELGIRNLRFGPMATA